MSKSPEKLYNEIGTFLEETRDDCDLLEFVSEAQSLLSEVQAPLQELSAMQQRLKEVMEQRHGDRYGSLWMDTFHFIKTGERTGHPFSDKA